MSSSAIRSFGPIDPESYLHTAISWSLSSDEAVRRSAVDRAYYAAFLTARNELTDKGYIVAEQGPVAHILVGNSLTRLTGIPGRILRALRRTRNRVTYQTDEVSLPQNMTVEQLLGWAKTVIEAAQALPQSPT